MIGDGDTSELAPTPARPGGLFSAGGSSSAGVSWALRLTAVAVLAGCAATQYLSRVTAPMQVARAPFTDPVTTGSIAQAARGTTLDPCTGAALRR